MLSYFFRRKNAHDGLTFMGGGILGYAHFGVISALEERGLLQYINSFSGASVGSIMAALCALRISIETLVDLKESFNWDMKKLFDGSSTYAGEIFQLVETFGMYEGAELRNMIESFIEKVCGDKNITFLEAHQKYGTLLVIPITQVYTTGFEVIHYNYLTHPNEKISHIVNISCSYPWIFPAVNGMCDGGLSNNFPIKELECVRPLGILFEEPAREKVVPRTILEFSLGVLAGAKERLCIIPEGYDIIKVPSLGMHSLDFAISEEQKTLLFQSGYNSTLQFLL